MALRKQWPQTLKEVDLSERIRAAGGANLKQAGEFFGWQRGKATRAVAAFSKEELLKNGWTKELLMDVADGYEQIARITPNNPSARSRARQLRELARLVNAGEVNEGGAE